MWCIWYERNYFPKKLFFLFILWCLTSKQNLLSERDNRDRARGKWRDQYKMLFTELIFHTFTMKSFFWFSFKEIIREFLLKEYLDPSNMQNLVNSLNIFLHTKSNKNSKFKPFNSNFIFKILNIESIVYLKMRHLLQ